MPSMFCVCVCVFRFFIFWITNVCCFCPPSCWHFCVSYCKINVTVFVWKFHLVKPAVVFVGKTYCLFLLLWIEGIWFIWMCPYHFVVLFIWRLLKQFFLDHQSRVPPYIAVFVLRNDVLIQLVLVSSSVTIYIHVVFLYICESDLINDNCIMDEAA